MQSGWGWRVLQEVRALTRRITRHEERTLSIGVMKPAMLLVWLMMASVSYWPSPYPSTRMVVAWTPTAVTTTERPSFCPNEPKKLKSSFSGIRPLLSLEKLSSLVDLQPQRQEDFSLRR